MKSIAVYNKIFRRFNPVYPRLLGLEPGQGGGIFHSPAVTRLPLKFYNLNFAQG